MDKPFQFKIGPTLDGSNTLKLTNFDEQYHSTHGALQESVHVFINSGLKIIHPTPDPIFVLEIGMGTGLNALLTAREAFKHKHRLFYDGIEAYPIDELTVQSLNYPDLFETEMLNDVFTQIHAATDQRFTNIRDRFFIRLFRQKIQDCILQPTRYHLIYFDAFSPDTQPEMWTVDVFKQLFCAMKPGGVLVTYSSRGRVRRNMKLAGFDVKKIPGPPGKREISRAVKPVQDVLL